MASSSKPNLTVVGPRASGTGVGPAGPARPGPAAVADGTATRVRTPWGRVAATPDDRATRDPFEPDAPVPAGRATGPRAADAGPEAEPLSPRELFEMLMTPAANPSRSSPARMSVPPAAAQPEVSADPATFPAQADLVLSALEAGSAAAPRPERRTAPRRTYRVRAALRLFSDAPAAPAWTVYTRDVHARGLGFITPHRLPLGYGGLIELPDPAGGGDTVRIPCTLLRCREAAPGWFEGSLYFNREQPGFDAA